MLLVHERAQLLPRPIDKNATMNTVLNETVKYLRDLRQPPPLNPPPPSKTSTCSTDFVF